MDVNEENVGHLASRVAEALGEQVELHVELVKAEVAREVAETGHRTKAFVASLVPSMLGLPLVCVGYVFTCVAVGLALAPWLGTAGGLGVVGVLNLLVGGLAIRTTLLHLRARGTLGGTVSADPESSANDFVAAAPSSTAPIEAHHVR